MNSKLQSLKKLIPANLKVTTPLEKKLLAACIDGDAISGEVGKTSPKERNVIRGEFLSWLCGDKEASKFINHSGIEIENASIKGEIKLIGATIEFPLRIKKCVFWDSVSLDCATLINLDIRGSHLKKILSLEFMKTSGSLFFDEGFISDFGINLLGAEIHGNLYCSGGTFRTAEKYSLYAELASVRGSVFLDESSHLNAELSFADADIRGTFDCDGGSFENVNGNSINLERTKITGSVFFRSKATRKFQSKGCVRLYETWIGGSLECDGGQFQYLDGEGNAIDAFKLTVIGPVFMRNNFESIGCVDFSGARIGNVLDCSSASFNNKNEVSLQLDKARVDGGVFLSEKFSSIGQVILDELSIGGSLVCEDSSFQAKRGENAINADGVIVSGVVLMRNQFRSVGCLRFHSAKISGDFDCSSATFDNEGFESLILTRAHIEGNVYLSRGFNSIGLANLQGARLGGNLDCDDGTFNSVKGRDAIIADGLVTGGIVSMKGGFKATGCVSLYGAKIGNTFDCSGASFENEGADSLLLTKAQVDGNVLLGQKFNSKGMVSLAETTIRGTLDCENGHFDSGKNEVAILASGLTTTGPVLMRWGFSAIGCVNLYGARIGSDLECNECSFEYSSLASKENLSKDCFIGKGMQVGGEFMWINHKTLPKGDVVLEDATAKSFFTDTKSWFEKKDANKTVFMIYSSFAFLYLEYFLNTFFIKPSVHMDGFAYDYFRYGNENNSEAPDIERVKNRLMWLSLRPAKHKSLQPYTAVIKALATSGHGNDARKIAIAREKQRSKNLPLLLGLIRNIFYGWTVDYGYSPAKALPFVLAVILVGYFIFGSAKTSGAIIPTQGPVERQNIALSGGRDRTLYYPYPEFVPLAYSIDVFFPIVDLHQEEYWMPSSTTEQGGRVLNYMWFHIAAGWLLTTLFVAAITGIVRTGTD